MDVNVAKLFAAALALIPLFGVGLGLGKIFSSYVESVGRNPAAKKDLQTAALLGGALTEAIALLALVVSLLLIFVV